MNNGVMEAVNNNEHLAISIIESMFPGVERNYGIVPVSTWPSQSYTVITSCPMASTWCITEQRNNYAFNLWSSELSPLQKSQLDNQLSSINLLAKSTLNSTCLQATPNGMTAILKALQQNTWCPYWSDYQLYWPCFFYHWSWKKWSRNASLEETKETRMRQNFQKSETSRLKFRTMSNAFIRFRVECTFPPKGMDILSFLSLKLGYLSHWVTYDVSPNNRVDST